MLTDAVPRFVNERKSPEAEAEHVAEARPVAPLASAAEMKVWVVVTAPTLENEPINPKTNPPIDTAAIRVIASKITVAITGLIPFLLASRGLTSKHFEA